MFDKTTPILNKHSWSILVLIVLLLAISTIAIRFEQSRIYAVCREAMLTVKGFGPWEYQYTSFFPSPVTVIFDDGVNTTECHVQLHDLKWEVTGGMQTLAGCLPPCEEGYYGVIP